MKRRALAAFAIVWLLVVSALIGACSSGEAPGSGEEDLDPAIFYDVAWSVQNEETYVQQGPTVVTALTLQAGIMNDSSETIEVEELPSLVYGDNVVPLAEDSIISHGAIKISVHLTFDESEGPYEFSFETTEGSRPFEGLDGVAEGITDAYSTARSELPQDIADLEARRSSQEEEERAQREEAARVARERTVWVLGDNDTYHTTPYCYHIRNRGATAMTLDEAIDLGCVACGDCG